MNETVLENIYIMLNNGLSDSAILMLLVLADTILALTYNMKTKGKVLSNEMLSGLLRNFLLSVLPSIINLIAALVPRNDNLYNIIASMFTLLIAFAVVESILAYVHLWGIKYPSWLEKFLLGEIESKEVKKDESKEETKKGDEKDVTK